jgi:hypothetical protein
MNIKNLKTGMVVKNYKELCKLLGEKVKTGNAKYRQIEEFKRYFEWEKDKYAFIITKVYKRIREDKLKKERDKNFKKVFIKNNPNFKIKYKQKHEGGVYKIVLNNKIYIGSTVDFHRRYLGHKASHNKYPTKEMIDNGATFELLWLYEESEEIEDDFNKIDLQEYIEDFGLDEYRKQVKIEIIRAKEVEFIKEYVKKEEYEVVNIEYAKQFRYKLKKYKIKNKREEDRIRPIYIKNIDYENVRKILEENNIKYKTKRREK